MNQRQWKIIRLALCYAQANFDDIINTFHPDEEGLIDFNGELIGSPTQDEIDDILMMTQQ